MGLLSVRRGDLFFSDAPALGHGVNVQGVMGAGVAKEFRALYPAMYDEYVDACRSGALRPGGMLPWHDERRGRWVYNLATQDEPGRTARLEWLESAAAAMVTHAETSGVRRVALPRIGCGVGGLRWDEVREALVRLAGNTSVRIEVWEPA